MQIRVGFEMEYQCRGPTPMIQALSVHYSRASDLVRPDHLVTSPAVPVTAYRDPFGNWCSRIVAPQGRFVLSADAVVNDTGEPDVVVPGATQTPVEHLPESARLATTPSSVGVKLCEAIWITRWPDAMCREISPPTASRCVAVLGVARGAVLFVLAWLER